MKKTVFTSETLIYVLLAMGTYAEDVAEWTPKKWIGLAIAGLLVLKAKLSTGLKSDREVEGESKRSDP